MENEDFAPAALEALFIIYYRHYIIYLFIIGIIYLYYLCTNSPLQSSILSHLCRPVRSTSAVRETASLGIMGAPRVPPLNPSESIVLSDVERTGRHKWV